MLDVVQDAVYNVEVYQSGLRATIRYLSEWAVLIASVIAAIAYIRYKIKKPYVAMRESHKKTIKEAVHETFEESGLVSRIEALEKDNNQCKIGAIVGFAQDLKNGEEKSGTQWDQVIKLCDEYIKSGRNGRVKVAADSIMAVYKQSMTALDG